MFIDPATHREIVQSLSDKLKAYYVFPDIAEQISTCLQKHLDEGAYTGIDEGEFLAFALTMHLQEVNHDEHLWVKWHAEPLPEDEGALRHNRDWQDERMLEARLDNYGLYKVDRLPGNVGYIDIRYFHRPAWGGDTAVAAMTFLAYTNALIIDLRKCTGGYPGMIALILSYLFGEQPIHLSSIYWRDEDITQQYWTLPYVPGKHFSDKPVYVLTSKVTFSGGEEFASILQTRKRAIVIGDKTDGGAHPGTSYRLHPHFEVFIPIGRTINPVTGTDFESIGVTPDILIPQEQAFTAAYQMALQAVLENLGTPSSKAIQSFIQEAQTALDQT
jgi:C-terminal processing protease CtpA/Prc